MPKVLIVDDVPDNVELLACALEDEGYEVVKAYNGIEAIEVARSTEPDVIVLDIRMPGIDGIEVCRRLKADPELRPIPVIMVSALAEDTDLRKGLEAGAQDYIIKPYNVLVALAQVRAAALWKLTADSLREREQRFQAVFNQTFQFMGLLDPQGVVLEVNRVALEFIKAGRESVVGRPFWKGPWWADSPQTREQLEADVAKAALGRMVNFEVAIGNDGEHIDLEFSLMPVTDKSGRVLLLLVVGHDITDRKRAEEGLRKLSRAVEQSPVMVLITDARGVLEYVNPRFSAVTGYTLDEVRGKSPRILKSGQTPSETYRRLWETITAGGEWRGEIYNKRKDGGFYWGSVSVSPLLNEQGVITHFIGIQEDITERKRVEATLRQAKETAETASRSKGEFLANVSHEIRTPLNAILGLTDATLATVLTPEQRENLDIVKSATDALLSIINDLLDFSKMDSGSLQLDPIELNLRDNLGDMLAMLGLRAHAKGLELACRIHPEVPDQLIGDPARLRQILVNLIGNAIKFTERGEVVVDVEAEPQSAGEVMLHFRVTDTGIGVPADKREAIFAPFTQADGSTTRLYGGTGLGLAISSQLVSLMGGRIWVESEVGRGSTFHFTAHLVLAREVRSAEPTVPDILRDVRVLVVDDDPVNRRILEEILTYWRMKPTLADGGVAALAHVERARDAGTPFSLVLVDALMEDMDGFTLAELIDAEPGLKGTVVLMLTPSDRQGVARRLQGGTIKLRGGSTIAFVSKPIRQSELRAVILAIVAPTPRADNRPSPVGPSSQRPLVRPLRILLAEDNPFNQRVVVLMQAKSGHTVTIAVNGREAVAALGRQSFDLVLMDLQMPEMDGFQATAAIRSAEAGTAPHPHHRLDRPRHEGRSGPLPGGRHGRLRQQADPAR